MSHFTIVSRETLFAALAWRTMVAAITCLAFNHHVRADEEWSRFRGPNGSGVASGVQFPATWTEDDYLWKVPLPGKGHSSPIGWGDHLYLTTGNAETGEISLLGINADDGQTLWMRSFASVPHSLHAANHYASSSCAADADRVYVVWASPASMQIAAVDHLGEVKWQRDLGGVDYKHGYGISPILVDDLVIVANDNSSDSSVVALDAASGGLRWRRPRTAGVESYATPAVWRDAAGGEQIIVNSTAEGMAGLSPADGAVLWKLPTLFPVRCVASPLVAGGLVFGCSGEGGNGKSFAAVRPGASGAEAAVAYELKKSLPQVPTPVAAGELLFIWSDRGVLTCCDVASGDAHWTERVGGNFYGSPIIAGDKLICVTAEGEAIVLAASTEYELLGRTPLGEASHATPAVHRGKLYLRTESALACLPESK